MEIFKRRINQTTSVQSLTEEKKVIERILCDVPEHSKEMKTKLTIVSQRLSEILDKKNPSK